MKRFRLPESEITDEALFLRRRELLRLGAGAVLGLGLAGCPAGEPAAARGGADGSGNDDAEGRPPRLEGVRDAPARYRVDEAVTRYEDATSYNNFYELGTDKRDPARNAHRLVGFPLGDLLKRFEPGSKARYVAFETLHDPEQLPGQRRPVLDWPYREGLRMDEAMHPLTILAVGMYGRELPGQNGAPLRLVVPWKYGFKSIKSIVRISLREQQPPTSWHEQAPDEYGFYANVNPEVDHPRWSQARERRLGDFFKRPTLPFNGYGEAVAGLYEGMDLRRFF